MLGRHQRKIFAPPIGAATPNIVYTQQAARTQFTHSKLPNPHARKTSPFLFRISYWHSYPERSLHTARRQTRMPGKHHNKCFASPIGRAIPNNLYTQQAHLHTASEQTRMPTTHQRKIFASPSGTATPNRVYTLSAAPATQTGAAGQRRPGAPQPFLEALSTAPAI